MTAESTDDQSAAGEPMIDPPFFTPVAEHEPPVEREPPRYVAPPWMRVPVDFVPTTLPVSELVGITDDGLAVVLSGIEVFPTGIRFCLTAVPEPGNEGAVRAAASNDVYPDMAGINAQRLARRLRIGLHYDDHRTATNLHVHGPEEAAEAPPAVLRFDGGHGGPQIVASAHWAWPIPDDGDLTLVIAWPARGIPERRLVLPGDELRAAAATSRANAIWPGAVLPPPTPRGSL